RVFIMHAPSVGAIASVSSANGDDCGSRRYTGTRFDWVDRVAPQRAHPRQRVLLVGAREPAIADDISDKDSPKLAGLGHGAPRRRWRKTREAPSARRR